MKVIDLSPVREELTDRLSAMRPLLSPYRDPLTAMRKASSVVFYGFSRVGLDTEDGETLLRVFGGTSGPVLMTGCPIGHLPETPIDGKRPDDAAREDYVSELFILGLADLMALKPISYANEKGGEVIHQVCPVPGFEGSKSNMGSDDFAFHIEAPHHDLPPDVLLLMGLRGNPLARTTVVNAKAHLEELDAMTLAMLLTKSFKVRLGESFGSETYANVRVLDTDGRLRVDFEEMIGATPDAQRALERLRGVMLSHVEGVALREGDLLVWDNRRTLHGRTSFPVKYNGRQRWLQRMYLSRNVSHTFFCDPDRPWVVRA